MTAFGVATEEDMEPATLREHLLQDIDSNNSLFVGRSEIGIWPPAP